MSCLGRERIFEHFSRTLGTRVALLRLNYACDLRYGVLVDIARKIQASGPIEMANGHFNCIWQGDANDMALRALSVARGERRARCEDALHGTHRVGRRGGRRARIERPDRGS